MTGITDFKQQYSDYTSEYLLELRARGDLMVPNAQRAVEELLAERGELVVPEASAIAPVAPRLGVLQMSAADAKKKAGGWRMFPLHLLGGALASIGVVLHGSPDSFAHPFLTIFIYVVGGLVGLISSMTLVEYIYRTRATPWPWLLGLVPIYFIAYLVLIILLSVFRLDVVGALPTLVICMMILSAIRRGNRERDLPALMLAAGQGDTEGMRIAFENGDVIDRQDDQGGTALSYAALNNQESAVRWLLNHGADPHICSRHGHSPADIAEKKGFHELAKIIREGAQSDVGVTK
jgi:hypothetical protein